MLDDEELICRIAENDSGAFEQLVQRYQSMVLNICYGLLGDYHQAEEAAQDVFVQIYKKAESFRHESKVSTWIYRIAVNLSLNLKRRDRITQWMKNIGFVRIDKYSPERIPFVSKQKNPMELLEQKESMQTLRKAVDRLPEKQKTAFILNQFEGFTAEEISEILEVSINTVEVRIHRAKRKLQGLLTHQIKKNVPEK